MDRVTPPAQRGPSTSPGGSQPAGPMQAQSRQPMGEAAYQRLRDEIVDGTRPPGSALIQLQLAAELGISRTPLREALGRLTHEGLVLWEPGNGYVVKSLSPASRPLPSSSPAAASAGWSRRGSAS